MKVRVGIIAAIILSAPAMAGQVTVSPRQSGIASVDFGNAKPMPLPQSARQPVPGPTGFIANPGVSLGGIGSGGGKSQLLPFPRASSEAIPVEAGTSNHPFTTARVNAYRDYTERFYPFAASGKLFFNIPNAGTFVCSASLIKPGVVVTAAHCVANFGKSQFYNSWTFVPAYNSGVAPFGSWTALTAAVLTAYYNGSDPCAQSGVICQDDVALLVLNPQSGHYAGYYTGWLGYGWNGYSYFSWLGKSQAQITQLGYPVALDGGNANERNDSLGYIAGSSSNNTVIGSLMTGGSSGGPWIANLGIDPSLAGISHGSMPAKDVVVGVTSWGYTDATIKEQGASPFTSNNIVVLVNYICTNFGPAC